MGLRHWGMWGSSTVLHQQDGPQRRRQVHLALCVSECVRVCVFFVFVYRQSMELSGNSPRGGAFPGRQDGGSMVLGAGSTFSESSILSAVPSQLMWNLVTRGLDASMFLWSCEEEEEEEEEEAP